jgi:hypothetical protein
MLGVKIIRIDPLEPNIWLSYVSYAVLQLFSTQSFRPVADFKSRQSFMKHAGELSSTRPSAHRAPLTGTHRRTVTPACAHTSHLTPNFSCGCAATSRSFRLLTLLLFRRRGSKCSHHRSASVAPSLSASLCLQHPSASLYSSA